MKRKHLFYFVIAGSMTLVSCGGSDDIIEEVENTDVVYGDVSLTAAEMEQASAIYFDRCAGCHGSSRLGATGPHLLPEAPEGAKAPGTVQLGTAGLTAFIENGTPAGMPEWKGIMTDDEIELMTRFLQVPTTGNSKIRSGRYQRNMGVDYSCC